MGVGYRVTSGKPYLSMSNPNPSPSDATVPAVAPVDPAALAVPAVPDAPNETGPRVDGAEVVVPNETGPPLEVECATVAPHVPNVTEGTRALIASNMVVAVVEPHGLVSNRVVVLFIRLIEYSLFV